MITGAPNLNTLWAELIVEELARNGVDHFVISPGSRSTPLTVAAARNPKLKTTVHYDERGAAFFALGVAKALGRPCALICTSGTAVANYFPAIVEASMSYVPLIVLTADRPPELQNTGANQTINQTNIYGEYVRQFVAMPCPDETIPLEYVLTTIDRACNAARRSPSGPVHVNCAYREPLAPVTERKPQRVDAIQAWLDLDRPYTSWVHSKLDVSREEVCALVETLRLKRRVLVVVGQQECFECAAEDLNALRVFRSWPVFADVTSGSSTTRTGSPGGHPVDCFDLLLQSSAFKKLCQPEAVIQLGGPIISKRLQEHLASVRPEYYVRVSLQPEKSDPGHLHTHRFQCSTNDFLETYGSENGESSMDWGLHLEIASERAQKAVWDLFKLRDELTEIDCAMELGALARENPSDAIFAANSMPVRYMDMYAGLSNPNVRVLANRGASGIDGNVATAVGYSMASNRHVVAVVGDLAALHDLNSLALLQQEGVRVTLIVLNNDGGGIFHFLPIAEHADVFEKYFATPHGLHFEDAARMFGLPYARPTTRDEFVEAFAKARESGGSSIIEVVTNREENLRLHRRIGDAVVKALDKL